MSGAGDQPSRPLDLPGLDRSADVAALLLAACDDRDGMAAIMRSLTMGELPELFRAAVEVGGSLVRYSDRFTSREFLERLIPAIRETLDEQRSPNE